MKKFFLYVVVAAISLCAGILFHFSAQKDFHTIDGNSHNWSDFEQQWVVINYFAEWCAPCLKEVPELNKFHHNSKIPLFAISFDGESDLKMHEISEKYNMEFSIISAESAPILPISKPRALPTTYILNPQGQLEKTLQGEVTHKSLIAIIGQLKTNYLKLSNNSFNPSNKTE